MRSRSLLASILCVFLAGCGSSQPTSLTANGAGNIPVRQPWTSQPPPAQQTPTYRGQTAAQWSKGLHDNDAVRRQEASQALRELRGAGFPHLFQGIQSPSSDVRLTSLQALDPRDAAQHAQEVQPVLRKLVNDPLPSLRQMAVGRLAWFGAASRDDLATLQQIAENDPDPDVRDAALASIDDIRVALKRAEQAGR